VHVGPHGTGHTARNRPSLRLVLVPKIIFKRCFLSTQLNPCLKHDWRLNGPLYFQKTGPTVSFQPKREIRTSSDWQIRVIWVKTICYFQKQGQRKPCELCKTQHRHQLISMRSVVDSLFASGNSWQSMRLLWLHSQRGAICIQSIAQILVCHLLLVLAGNITVVAPSLVQLPFQPAPDERKTNSRHTSRSVFWSQHDEGKHDSGTSRFDCICLRENARTDSAV